MAAFSSLFSAPSAQEKDLSLSREGVLPLNKQEGYTSFALVAAVRRLLGVKKVGHTGTLDPFASGVLILLVGKTYTKQADLFLNCDKEYRATLQLGIATDTFDKDGIIQCKSTYIPSLQEVELALLSFQGTIQQIPPMFSAKKVNGKKLYELARQGKEISRKASTVTLSTTLLSYSYPFIQLHIHCSKGTYIRSIAHDLGVLLQCGACVCELQRVRSGPFRLEECLCVPSPKEWTLPPSDLLNYLRALPLSAQSHPFKGLYV